MKPVSGWLDKLRALLPGKRAPLLLNLGCGARFHRAWVNLDVMPQSPDVRAHDLHKPLPFEDGSCAVVYHSHVLEHFPRAFAPIFLKECHRVLMSGGILRVVVPDLEVIARLYLENLDGALAGDEIAARRYEWLTLELMDQMVREESGGEMLKYWRQNPMPAEDLVIERMGREVLHFLERHRAQTSPPQPPPAAAVASFTPPDPVAVSRFRAIGEVHKWMYDRWSLRRLLEQANFCEAKVCGAGQSQIPDFASYQLDTDESGATRKPDSLFMEARKPT